MQSFFDRIQGKLAELSDYIDPASPSFARCKQILCSLEFIVAEERKRLSTCGTSDFASVSTSLGVCSGVSSNSVAFSRESLSLKGITQASRTIRKPTVPIESICILKSSNPHIVAKAKKDLEDSNLLRTGKANIVHFNSHLRGISYIHCDSVGSQRKVKDFLENLGYPVREPKIVDQFVSIIVPDSFVNSRDFVSSKVKIHDYLQERDAKFKDRIFSVEEFIRFECKYIAVLKVQAELFEAIRKEQFTYFGIERRFFKPWFKVVQCFRCSAYGHFSIRCISKTEHCPYCSLDHSLDRCSKLVEACFNCLSRKWPCDHLSFSKVCPVRKEYIQANKVKF